MQSSYMPNGAVQFEFFTGGSDAELTKKMDGRAGELRAEGHTGFNRAPVGRNAPCPCRSGRKFKHCCISRAR
jgi:uncharacterized protein YchJ